MAEQEVYRHLIDWLRQTPWDLPETTELMPLVMATYTPEEASLLTGMPFSYKSLEELAEMKQMEPAELGHKLDALAKKGLVFRIVTDETTLYRPNGSFFAFHRGSFWPGRTDERSKAMAPWLNQYYYHGHWDHWDYTHLKLLRTLPIHEVIEDTRQILPYEEVAKVLDSQDYFTVSTCPCRHRKNIDPDSPDCEYPTETCLHFGQLGHYIVENDLGREITRQEANEILRQCAEAGLVHGTANFQQGVDTICNCCRCCCICLEAFHKLKHTEGMSPSNYQIRSDPEACIGCGLCVKRCPMETIRLEDSPETKNRITRVTDDKGKVKELKNKTGKVAVVNLDLCIGCGVCAYKCSTQSLVLERCEVIEDPPKDAREFGMRVAADFTAARPAQKRDK